MSPRPLLPLLALVPLCLLQTPSASAQDVALATYRSVDDLTLDPERSGADIASVTGRMVTEVTGSACAGYTTSTRMVVRVVAADGGGKVNDSRTLTIETPDGRFDFDNASYIDGKLDQASKGTAQRAGGTITVTLTKPAPTTADLDAALAFPTEQLQRILAAARAGTRFLSFTTYDGLDDGLSPAPTSTIIGAGSNDPGDVGDETAIAEAGVASVRHWPVTIAYFDKDTTADRQPDFSLRGILYDNGIMREQHLDFGNFSLSSKLVGLTLLPAQPCP